MLNNVWLHAEKEIYKLMLDSAYVCVSVLLAVSYWTAGDLSSQRRSSGVVVKVLCSYTWAAEGSRCSAM